MPDYVINKRINKLKGQALVMALFIVAVGSLLAVSILQFGTFDLSRANQLKREKQAEFLAEAGLERAVYELNIDQNYTGGTYNDLSGGTYVISITTSGTDKIITSNGLLPQGASLTNAKNKIKRRVTLNRSLGGGSVQQIPVENAVFIGTDGIDLQNSSSIDGSAKTEGNIACQSNTITGDAIALGTIGSNCQVNGTKYENTDPGDLPTFDYEHWRDEANINNDPINASDLDCDPQCNVGPRKIIGDIILTQSQIMNLTGAVYITGTLTLENSSKIKIDQSLVDLGIGTVLIVDGLFEVKNTSLIETSAGPTFILIGAASTGTAAKIANSSNNEDDGPVIYATNGTVEVSNSGSGIALVAKGLIAKNSAIIDFNTPDGNPSGGSYATQAAAIQYLFQKGTFQKLK